jgi:hypothetical protein
MSQVTRQTFAVSLRQWLTKSVVDLLPPETPETPNDRPALDTRL